MEKELVTLNLERDLNEIASLIWGYMDKTYISDLKSKINGYRQECKENLCKEAQLIRALIPFMSEEKKMLEFVIDLIIYNDMIERSFKDYEMLSNLYRDENKDRESLKKLTYKLILFKLITAIEKGE
ncbi:hypothetical protein [Cellulosilyticum sp. I15G10I2]|uniref:hypothetical protein n=1 Tax=Cellulosilyticum sp. I15G10I2 TaxID=1892843 RepID=UPI00085C3CF9|nr:hypothetical protein [Cellulosilyticum sp. I15G10I2]